MTGGTFLGVALAGGVGACARFWLDRGVQKMLDAWGDPAAAKLGIFIVNVIGCFLAGAATQLVPGALMPAVSTGFLGGFTTFSTALLGCGTGGHCLRRIGSFLRNYNHYVGRSVRV